jgi:helix-turn-helix protein
MTRKIKEAERPASPLESTPKSLRELNGLEPGLTPNEMANLLRVSTSFLAKSRMRGDGPPYAKVGRSIRYFPSGVVPWLKSRQRSSTSE